MGRHKKPRYIPAELRRMMEVVALILDRHIVGILVIEGRTELEDKDIAAMYALARDIPMRGKAPLDVQSFADAAELVGYMELNRCRETLPKAATFYKEREPRKYAVLREIGLPGMPGARSLERIAAAHGIYTKTLYAWKREAIRGIAEAALSLRGTPAVSALEHKERRSP